MFFGVKILHKHVEGSYGKTNVFRKVLPLLTFYRFIDVAIQDLFHYLHPLINKI